MPVTIGARQESNFADPIGLLIDCHRRIERFLDVLAKVGEQARGGPLTADERASMDNALRYFREAAPKHTADEEQTLFPRMRASGGPEAKAVLARVDALEEDHRRADRAHAEVDRIGLGWLAAGSLGPEEAARFAELVGELGELYREHIAIEEQEVFPAAARILGDSDRKAAGSEMAARRGAHTQLGAKDL